MQPEEKTIFDLTPREFWTWVWQRIVWRMKYGVLIRLSTRLIVLHHDTGWRWPIAINPLHWFVLPLSATDRQAYYNDRALYRRWHRAILRNIPMTHMDWRCYQTIAEKYGWPFLNN